MSLPARQMPAPSPRPTPARAPAPTRAPAPSRAPAPGRAPTPRVRRRPRVHMGFIALSGVLITALVVGLVALNAVLAQTAFHMNAAQEHLSDLRRANVRLTEEAARLSSPEVVATWARRHRMVTPAVGEVHVLHVPGSGR